MSVSTKASLTTRESKIGKRGDSSSHANKTNFSSLTNSPIDQISFLQRAVGNREVERLLKSGVIQPGRTLGRSVAKPVFQSPATALPPARPIQTKFGEQNDKLGEEADRVTELTGNGGGSILPSAVGRSLSPVESLHHLCGNQAVLQMRNDSGGPPVPSVPSRPSQSRMLQRKCACGGAAGVSGECEECRKKKQLGLQAKLQISEAGDIYEREADRVADRVMSTSAHSAVTGSPPRIQRLAGQSTGQGEAAPASVDQALAIPGRPLEPALRQDMEQRFGYDFSGVRVHPGAAAEQSAQDVNANAYTVGQRIIFAKGRFAPGTHEGRRLIAHELTHVVQQSGAGGSRQGQSRMVCQIFRSQPPGAASCSVRLPVRPRPTTRGWSSKESGAAIQRNLESFIRVCSATARFPRVEVTHRATRFVSARKLASSLRKARILFHPFLDKRKTGPAISR